MKKIILIGGKARHGKDSVAKNLYENLQGKTFVISYGDYLKFFLQRYYNWDGKKDERGRLLLQKVGTDIIRRKHPDFHVQVVMNVIYVFKDDYDYFVIPDVRFTNEITIPRKIFGKKVTTVWVDRPNYESQLTKEQKNHVSENNLKDWKFDYIINNQNGLNELEDEVKRYIKEVILDEC